MLHRFIVHAIVLCWIARVCWRLVVGRNNVMRDMPDWVFCMWRPHIEADQGQDELTRKLRWHMHQENFRRKLPPTPTEPTS